MVYQYRYIVTFMYIFAHTAILRRKRRGIQPKKGFKQLMRTYFKELCVQAGVEEPDALADKLALLFEGAVVTSQVSQKPQAAKTAKDIAKSLIEQLPK
jgi:hypothetical protein